MYNAETITLIIHCHVKGVKRVKQSAERKKVSEKNEYTEEYESGY